MNSRGRRGGFGQHQPLVNPGLLVFYVIFFTPFLARWQGWALWQAAFVLAAYMGIGLTLAIKLPDRLALVNLVVHVLVWVLPAVVWLGFMLCLLAYGAWDWLKGIL